jgi:hypothetical protein
MNPGPELDALVAEKVMGWTIDKLHGFTVVINPEMKKNDWIAFLNGFSPYPAYSTDIAAAWSVVKKFDYLYLFRSPEINDGMYECKLTMADERKYYALSESAPHAICLAALRAVGVEI